MALGGGSVNFANLVVVFLLALLLLTFDAIAFTLFCPQLYRQVRTNDSVQRTPRSKEKEAVEDLQEITKRNQHSRRFADKHATRHRPFGAGRSSDRAACDHCRVATDASGLW